MGIGVLSCLDGFWNNLYMLGSKGVSPRRVPPRRVHGEADEVWNVRSWPLMVSPSWWAR